MTRSSLLIAQKFSIIQVQGFINARNKLTALLWILALIASMSFMITQTGSLFKGFFFANKRTMVKLKSSELPFPAVTFCNLNPFKKNEAKKVPILATIMEVAQSVGSKISNARKKRQSLAATTRQSATVKCCEN
uniref:Uncharacterized protein n=1 Tax=Romanomermis culicivorax TaxID=13658 RepID=A0A915JX36_ROMCU